MKKKHLHHAEMHHTEKGRVLPLERGLRGLSSLITVGFVLLSFAVSMSASFLQVHAFEGVVEESPFTNSIPKSVYREFDPYTERDPFTRVGYLRPRPTKSGDPNLGKGPKVDIRLKLNSISSMGDSAIAILEDGQMLESGNTYEYKEGGVSIPYKVLRVTDGSVVILYGDKELEFKMKGSDLNLFIEKEESHEATKP